MLGPSRLMHTSSDTPAPCQRLAVIAPLLILCGVLPTTLLAQTQGNASMEVRYQEVINKNFADEPSVRTVQEDAIKYASAEPERANSWFNRSDMANIAPRRVQLRLDRDFKDNRNATSTGGLESSSRTDIDDDSFWQFTVEWDFSRMIFNPDTVRVATQAIDLAELREDVLNAVTKLYFERRALRLEIILKPPQEFAEFTKKRLRIDELTSDLDALTDGNFSRRIKQARQN